MTQQVLATYLLVFFSSALKTRAVLPLARCSITLYSVNLDIIDCIIYRRQWSLGHSEHRPHNGAGETAQRVHPRREADGFDVRGLGVGLVLFRDQRIPLYVFLGHEVSPLIVKALQGVNGLPIVPLDLEQPVDDSVQALRI